jgi:perosamine synthetase
MAIVRGRFSHSVLDDLMCLIDALFVSNSKDKYTKEFEIMFAKYIGRSKCLTFPFARTALYCTLKSLRLPPGSKILMPSITIKAMLDVVVDLDLQPVFVDSNLKESCVDLKHLEVVLNKNPDIRVAFLTYLFGVTPTLDEIIDPLKSRNIFIIEDFSQNLNSSYKSKKLGTFGQAAIYSTSSLKTLDLHGGGMFLCDDEDLLEKVESERRNLSPAKRKTLVTKIIKCAIKNTATTPIIFNLATFPLIKITSKFSEKAFSRLVGSRTTEPMENLPNVWFEKFTEAQAKFGIKAIKRVKQNDILREKVSARYNKHINSMIHIEGTNSGDSKYWQYLVFPNNPQKFRQLMLRAGIDTAQTSLINISNIAAYGFGHSDTPTSKWIYDHGVYIPIYANLSERDVKKIINKVNECINV